MLQLAHLLLLQHLPHLLRWLGPVLRLQGRLSLRKACAAVAVAALAACGGGGGGSSPTQNSGGSSIAEFVFDCDIEGANAVLTMQVEALASSGAVWGPGPTPQITGVIGTGSVIYYTAGTVVSATARYSFRGENQFADFTRLDANERFTVEWIVTSQGLILRANPFGPGPTQYGCTLRSARRV